MRILLILFVVSVNIVIAQNSYTIDKDVYVYDCGDDGFLTAIQKDNKAHIKHYDVSGMVIWKDSISFNNSTVDNSRFEWISKFKNTDEVVFCMSGDLAPYWSLGNVEDTLLFNFTKLNIGNHQFTGVLEDTLITNWTRSVEFKDTSIYIFSSDLSLGNNPRHYETHSLNPNMQLSLVSPPDSLPVENFLMSIYASEDEIYKYQTYQDYHFVESYTSQMSLIEHIDYSFTTGHNYNSSHYLAPLNKDSVFVFIHGFTYGGGRDRWRFDWRTLNLSPISSIQINSYTNNSSQNTRGIITGSGKVKVDRVNRLVVILGEESLPTNIDPSTPDIYQSILIYDYNSNLVCEKTIWSDSYGSVNSNLLTELNGRVYLISQNDNSQTLTIVNCNILGIDESKSESLNIRFFPNPVEDNLNVLNDKKLELKIKIQSLDGKLMKTINENDKNIVIDLSDFVSGVYLVVVEGDRELLTERIIKK